MNTKRWEKRDDESYDAHAQRIADAVGLKVEIKTGAPKCAPWGKDSAAGRHCPYGKCDGFHGKHWRVGLVTRHGNSYVFSYWSSVADDMKPFERPTIYDILACLSWDGPTTPDEVVEEYGDMKPSQAIACAEQNQALKALTMGASGVYTDSRMRELLSLIV